MARLTKSEIQQHLLAGKKIEWKDAAGKRSSITLDSAKQRRLLSFLLSSSVREVKGIPEDFIKELADAYGATGDPATQQSASVSAGPQTGPWKLHSIKAEGFGGVNAWKGAPFQFELEGNSLLLEGPNGSGKSSLTAAIVWALSAERPRDQAEAASNELRAVFGTDAAKVGDWPPIATYPSDVKELHIGPSVIVELTFIDPVGVKAAVRRTYNGKEMQHAVDPALHLPPILIETGLLMPSRLSKLRFDEGRGRLTDAVQTLTGLDELIELGTFVQGLCHSGRDYLSFKKSEFSDAGSEFERQVEAAKIALASVGVVVPNFVTADTDDANSEMAQFAKQQVVKGADLTKVISDDLLDGLDLANSQVQKQVVVALSYAERDIVSGLTGLNRWKSLETIATALPVGVRQALKQAADHAGLSLAAAVELHNKANSDTRYRLKALAALWHAEHGSGAIEECPTCQHSIKDRPDLQSELTDLQSAGEAATRKLTDNVVGILAVLEAAVPQSMRRYLSEEVVSRPREALVKAIEDEFITADHYQKYLTKAGALSKTALSDAPTIEMKLDAPSGGATEAAGVLSRIATIERLSGLAVWFETESSGWLKWWQKVAVGEEQPNGAVPPSSSESLSAHIGRLGKALAEAEPYRIGSEALRAAWKQGVSARKIEKELEVRRSIAEALEPLKSLGNMAEAQARDAIGALSGRIAQIHSANYLSDSLKFDSATLEKKAGLVVRGLLGADVRIDATLVANTSWVRGVLWAFIFALREEAIEQMSNDVFPFMAFDDPQQTFDSIHRHRWAEYIARLQAKTPGVQVILSSHDEQFLSFLAVDGVVGRRALIASAGDELGHIGIFDGDEIDRRWQRVLLEKTQKAAQDYMASVRVHVEGMLKLILRGEDVKVPTFVLGDSREKISVLNKAKLEPWARNVFETLALFLGKGVKEVKFIEKAHHSDGVHLGMTEATDVHAYWTKSLRLSLEKAFRTVREHRALHGGLVALHALPPTVSLPDGRRSAVSAISLNLVGSAAALTDGKAADGCVNLTIEGKASEVIELKSNVIYRLTTPTLEPVARPGDLLLVSEFKKPSAKSLVVARSEDRLLARRLEIADNHSDVAVLTASAINPRNIAAPVVAKLSTVTMQKIIGVLYDHGQTNFGKLDSDEICDCGGDSYVDAAFEEMRGLVSVDGHSAEPHALDKQFLIIANALPLAEACKKLEGRPVIAEDSSGSRYFKRLRAGGENQVILESLEIGGDFPPIVLASEPGNGPHVATVWPVIGVLFERPK